MSKIIEVKNLVKRYSSQGPNAVDNISFSVNKGEFFALLGPNGAGKTTTIKMLTTILAPTSGEMMLNDFDVTKNPAGVRKSFGIVFQDPSLDNELTAYENMQYHAILYAVPKEVYESRILELLKMVDLLDRKDDYVKNFSGGMKRRLEIARGLLHHPKVFFLDEPTIGLDPQTRNHMWAYIKELNKKEGVTVFFTTHYMEEAQNVADRIAIVDHGKIVAEGSVEELKAKTGSDSLEKAFLNLTGSTIRDEEASAKDRMRMTAKVWKR